MLNDYILGILYGDGYLQKVEKKEILFFSTTHKELADRVVSALIDNEIKHSYIKRTYDTNRQKKNYEILEIIQITDRDFIDKIKKDGYNSELARERIKFNSDFLRGYIETKGTLFQSNSRGNVFWRISLSGNLEDLTYIKDSLENKLDIKIGKVTQRKEREADGISSKSYRFSTQSRNSVTKIIKFIDGNEISAYLKEKINGFNQFKANTPFNAKRKVYKHYRNATLAMARELDLTIKGIRGSIGRKGFIPVYLWKGDTPVLCFKSWEWAYNWISAEYEKETGYDAPLVK